MLATCHYDDAAAVLKRCGFEQPRGGGRQFHLPRHLPEAEKKALATRAALCLTADHYEVHFDRSLLCRDTQTGFMKGRLLAAAHA